MPANDSWMYQGRDEKGRFGDGTSPHSGEMDVGSTNSGGGGNGLLPRMQAVVYGVVGHLSAAERPQYTASLDHGGVSRLSESLVAWSGAAALGRDAFRERFLGDAGSDEVVDHLRRAAEGASRATTPSQQRDASGELATAWQLVGASRWPRFAATAHDRTVADAAPSAGRVLLAQAATNTAMDASSGVNTAAATVPGRYVADNPQRWIGQNSVGTGECVPLVQAATGAPRSTEWQRGAQVQGNTDIRPGTAIATFDSNGRYDGHAAIYLGQDEHGIRVTDQWNIKDSQGHILGRQPPHERTLPLGDPQHSRVDRGELYHVVE
jgi:hypothetical protein